MTTARFRRLAAASTMAAAVLASAPVAQAAPAPAVAVVAESSTATVTSPGAPTSDATIKDEGKSHLFGYSLFAIILAVLAGSGAFFLRNRRGQRQ